MEETTQMSVTVTRIELVWIVNALNEVLHGMGVDDFATRMGGTKDEVKKLMAHLGRLLDDAAATEVPESNSR